LGKNKETLNIEKEVIKRKGPIEREGTPNRKRRN
jgi:hypothetical protein